MVQVLSGEHSCSITTHSDCAVEVVLVQEGSACTVEVVLVQWR